VNDVDSITHLAETYSKQPQFLCAYSYLTCHEAFYVLQRYSGFLILNRGESYLSIFLLLTAEAFGAYST
jgi:hypothetical protein